MKSRQTALRAVAVRIVSRKRPVGFVRSLRRDLDDKRCSQAQHGADRTVRTGPADWIRYSTGGKVCLGCIATCEKKAIELRTKALSSPAKLAAQCPQESSYVRSINAQAPTGCDPGLDGATAPRLSFKEPHVVVLPIHRILTFADESAKGTKK